MKCKMPIKWTGVCLVLSVIWQSSIAQTEIKLYEGTPPHNVNNINQEIVIKTDAGRDALLNVTIPSVFYFPAQGKNTSKAAVIICPGGGYHRLSIFDGGYEVAKEFAAAGVPAFVLKYRTNTDSAYTNYETLPFQDLNKAYRIICKNAAQSGIDTNNIGIIGFSAGGHLAAMASTPQYKLKLSFQVLVYPVISFTDALASTRLQSRKMLLGKNITEEKKRFYSPELWVNEQNPPTYLIHAADDPQSLVGNSLEYYKSLIAKNVPAQLHIYQKGGHGFALYNKEQNDYWMPSVIKWLKLNKVIPF